MADGAPVNIIKLNGNNYLAWSRAMELFITGKGKKDHLLGKVVIPAETDVKFQAWEAENSMLMSWILGSMNPDIGETFMLYNTVEEIWRATKEMYSKKG